MVCGPSGMTQIEAPRPYRPRSSTIVSSMRRHGLSRAARIWSSVRPSERTKTSARDWMSAWIWACHWSCSRKPGAQIFSRSSRGSPRFAQDPAVEPVLREAVGAARGDDDGASGLDDLVGRAQALDRLVEVEVERVAGIRRDDDVEGAGDGDHGRALDEGAAGVVGPVEIAGEDAGHGLVAVEGHVEEERAAGLAGDLAHFLPDGVAVGDAPDGLGVPDHPGVVVAEDGALAGHARHDGLAAAGESGEEVGLDETGQDLEVAAHELGVDPGLVAFGGHADADLCGRIEGFVLDDAAALEDGIPHHRPELGLGVGPMRAQSVEERHFDAGDGVKDFEDGPEEERMGRRTGDVAEDDADARSRADDLPQGQRTHGRFEGRPDGGRRVGQGRNEFRLDDGDVERTVEIERQARLSVGEVDAHNGAILPQTRRGQTYTF